MSLRFAKRGESLNDGCSGLAVSALFLKRRENSDQVSPLFDEPNRAELPNYASNIFRFKGMA